jgi:hypothetical protein
MTNTKETGKGGCRGRFPIFLTEPPKRLSAAGYVVEGGDESSVRPLDGKKRNPPDRKYLDPERTLVRKL